VDTINTCPSRNRSVRHRMYIACVDVRREGVYWVYESVRICTVITVRRRLFAESRRLKRGKKYCEQYLRSRFIRQQQVCGICVLQF
jgi:hypothetical protein